MKIGILSTGRRTYSTRRLKMAAKKRGHEVRVLHTLDFSIYVEQQEPVLFYRGSKFRKVNAILPRIGSSVTPYGLGILRQFEQLGVFSLNSSVAVAKARDKFRTLQILSRRDIGIPPSALVHREQDILPAIEQVGGAPVIIKLLQGTHGVGVMLAETNRAAEAIVETLKLAQKDVLIQKFVSESKGRDIRAFVVGNEVVAAMRRQAGDQEFRSNVHRGASTEAVVLSPEYERVAIRATHILGLRVAGVDILESNEGPKVMEINASPGLEGIEAATQVDIADRIIAYLEEQALFPDLDLRERLSLTEGFGVVELPVVKKSPLAHKTVRAALLKEQDIQILSVKRSDVVLPSPPDSYTILPGDLLLCFGRLIALKGLIPSKRRARKNSLINSQVSTS